MCEKPIALKSGLVVPCGKCILCLSHRREEWSTRLQLHTLQYDSMPFFVTLTYKPEEVVYGDAGYTLVPDHIRSFIKRIKDKYDLYNSDFAYFGCGEYGDKGDPALDRPHYHLLLFGFPQLEEAYRKSVLDANKLIYDDWVRIDPVTGDRYNLGFVDVGVAEWSGIHYVTKYVLKFDEQDYVGKQKPFVIFTRGIGSKWLDSLECKHLLYRLHHFRLPPPVCDLDYSTPDSLCRTASDNLKEIKRFMPKLVCTTPQGNKIALPRYYRKKIIGQFEHFKDSPFWYYDFLSKLIEATSYIKEYAAYDAESAVSHHQQVIDFAKRKIYHRLIIQQSKK